MKLYILRQNFNCGQTGPAACQVVEDGQKNCYELNAMGITRDSCEQNGVVCSTGKNRIH